ncbi:50S ribosomal protein L25/general stress protein Ctc [Leptospira biflexa]|jgi:large subunit ribosomal protein L25|uniref:Large ribosomal subunit protein bL25 n=1 Tax=Leptospira biflexa serovar Patoc (strain Patoc 1 / ATCC 23582 / Paris) TaxID=456481 RepID=B0SKG2_LEPBP|nr:50S ribosomal protein L25/general stress protein Ctc [Leptospira biflexa]ABZ92774.1 50S Ribosomal protein L25 [Leptospira biflexa serovar Patoc strain 'Patoc 1 (Ames)']ABZ96380.1 50S ribosomal protein L25 [Leptospira biflexa serovar Patoc strain 'Patoc 1 (Paris)']TGM37711.1 50S ribosomal protein L25/general stress protein Ctc [Leptospira biflexa]TGM41047.1 50S ribosomal protein L25/general stress protein Ctc [Leptospira biflexa]TGM47250.1 50S ribosomal protein L25/general stress protein Ctc
MEKISIKAQPRTSTGKGPARRMRVEGLVPANIIGSGEAKSASVVEKEIQKLIDSGIRKATLIDLELDGKSEKVFVKEIQRFPHTGQIRHIDFYKVTPGKKIQTTVAIKTTGVAKGSKAGGQFEHLVHEIKVKSTPEDLTDVITVDVTGLDIGMMIKVSELPHPQSWEILVNGDPIVASCNKTKAILAAERAEKAEADAAKGKPAAKKGAKK